MAQAKLSERERVSVLMMRGWGDRILRAYLSGPCAMCHYWLRYFNSFIILSLCRARALPTYQINCEFNRR